MLQTLPQDSFVIFYPNLVCVATAVIQGVRGNSSVAAPGRLAGSITVNCTHNVGTLGS